MSRWPLVLASCVVSALALTACANRAGVVTSAGAPTSTVPLTVSASPSTAEGLGSETDAEAWPRAVRPIRCG